MPSVTTQVATFEIIKALGLINSKFSVILLYIGADVVMIYVFLQFMKGIPVELDEAAKIEGCSYFGILRSGADTRATIYIDLVGMWLVGLPLAAVGILWLAWPFYWLYLIPVAQELIKLVLTLYRIGQRRWLRNLVSQHTES